MYTLVLLTNNKLTSIKILNHILEIVYLRIQYRQQKYCYTANRHIVIRGETQYVT